MQWLTLCCSFQDQNNISENRRAGTMGSDYSRRLRLSLRQDSSSTNHWQLNQKIRNSAKRERRKKQIVTFSSEGDGLNKWGLEWAVTEMAWLVKFGLSWSWTWTWSQWTLTWVGETCLRSSLPAPLSSWSLLWAEMKCLRISCNAAKLDSSPL